MGFLIRARPAGEAPFAGAPLAKLHWTRGGAPLTDRILGRDQISVALGSLDRPADVLPRMQDGVDSQLAWIEAIAAPPHRDIAGLFGPGGAAGSRRHPDHDT